MIYIKKVIELYHISLNEKGTGTSPNPLLVRLCAGLLVAVVHRIGLRSNNLVGAHQSLDGTQD